MSGNCRSFFCQKWKKNKGSSFYIRIFQNILLHLSRVVEFEVYFSLQGIEFNIRTV